MDRRPDRVDDRRTLPRHGGAVLTILVIFATTALLLSPAYISGQQAPAEAAEVKVAFIGDSGDGPNFGRVLQLIAAEDVDLILHQGDFSYSRGPTRKWLEQIDTYAKGIPYLGSEGNHDRWDRYYSGFFARQIAELKANGAVITGDPEGGNYAVLFRGLKMVFLDESPGEFKLNGEELSPADYIAREFAADTPDWKICSWHNNQRVMQVGGKPDEMSWPVYETCRELGAIIATAHEHSYHRTRTLTHMRLQSIDLSCPDDDDTAGVDVCVGPAKTFVFVSGLGGTGIRDQERCLPATFPYGCGQTWASIYTASQDAQFGALFITFNAGGNASQAHGYFKNISGEVIDQFRVTRTE